MLLLLAGGGDEAEAGEADEALALHLLRAENERARQGTRRLVASCGGGLGRSSGEGLEAAGKEPRREAVLGGGAAMQQGGSLGEDERERMRGSGGVGDGRWGSPLLAALERETRERSGEMGIEDDPDRDEWLAAEGDEEGE